MTYIHATVKILFFFVGTCDSVSRVYLPGNKLKLDLGHSYWGQTTVPQFLSYWWRTYLIKTIKEAVHVLSQYLHVGDRYLCIYTFTTI